MKSNFDAIYIEKLFGEQDYEIKFKDKRLILVASNGSGKTTILRIIYHYLSGQWELLLPEELDAISLIVNDEKKARYVVKKEAVQNACISSSIQQKYKRTSTIQKEALEALFEYKVRALQLEGEVFVRQIAMEYDVHEPQLNSILKGVLEEALNIKAQELPLKHLHYLFLPTFRRIERDVEDVFPDFVKNLSKLLLNGVEYLEQKVEQEEQDIGEKEKTAQVIEHIIQDYWRELNQSQKKINTAANISYETLVGFGVEDVKHQLNQALQTTNEDVKKRLELLLETCNSFFRLNDAELVQDNGVIQVKRASANTSSLKKLSSGEKQLVALFTHIIFSTQPVFLLFDEPEISLSVSWQKNLIEAINNLDNVAGFLIATHSGSIVMDQKWRTYLNGMERFKTRRQ